MAPRARDPRNAGLPLNVYRNRAAYRWRHPVSGKEFGLGNDRQSAFAQAHEANMEVLKLMDKPRLIHRITGAAETVAVWLEIYKANLVTLEKDGEIASSTLKDRVMKCNTIASSVIGGTIMKEVTTRIIADFLKTYDGKSRMQQAMRSLLLDIFREGITAGWCDNNPVGVTKSKRVVTKRERLSLEQFRLIYEKAKEVGPIWLVHFMELSLLTLQRRGDVAKMKYRDIADSILKVEQQKNRRLNIEGHKVAVPMELSIAGFTLTDTVAATRNVVSQLLVHHVKQQGQAKVGSKIRGATISEEFAAIRDQLGIGGENPPTVHEIRSLGGRLLEVVHGKAFVQTLMGHSSAKMTMMYLDERDGWFRPKIVTRNLA